MERLTDMAVFARVVEKSSFTAAGKELHLSTAAVSKHIARLEESLTLKLLDRHNRLLQPTEAGRVFYDHCVRILHALELARAETMGLTDEVKGVLRVHSTPGIAPNFVTRVVAEFAEAHPSIEVDLTVAALPINLASRGLDVIVTSSSVGQEDPKSYDTLISKKLGFARYVVCGAPSYFEKYGWPKHPEELTLHSCLVHVNRKRAPAQWQFVDKDRSYSVDVTARFRSTQAIAVVSCAIAGLGIAYLPEYNVRNELRSGQLVSIFDGQAAAQRLIQVFYNHGQYVPHKVRAFIDLLAKRHKPLLNGADEPTFAAGH
jgi:DNA-binding transcriptional LysR family regulator